MFTPQDGWVTMHPVSTPEPPRSVAQAGRPDRSRTDVWRGRHDGRRALHLVEEIGRHGGPPLLQVDDQHALAVEPGIDALQIAQRPNEEAGADQEQQRERDLRGDERREPARLARAA